MQYDHSPTESFISTPREAFSPLFTAATPSAVPGTMNPMDMLSPGYDDEDVPTKFEDNEEDTAESGMPSTSDKKPTKKRKSWGQVLPEPKTNLPPRKRAKTEDEKEQRRVERVLRNRRAAQSSRERKRKEVEALEDRNRVLEKALAKSEKLRELMAQQLAVYQRKEGSLPKSVTLSQELFSSQDSLKNEPDTSGLSFLDNIPSSSQAPNPTVNPASLSPELAPVSDVELAKVQETAPEAEAKPSKETSPASSDLTQHPAVSVGGGAGSISGLAEVNIASLGSSTFNDDVFGFGHSFGLSSTFDADRLIHESELFSSPNSTSFGDDYLDRNDTPRFTEDVPFDISDFLTDDGNGAADVMAASNKAAAEHGLDFSLFNTETQVSSENPFQQPQSGASTDGCDDGGLAVGL
jgi:transcriptional activator HAC1